MSSATEAVDQLIAQIRAACAPDAAPETRAQAAAACRMILTALEGQQPSPTTAPGAASSSGGKPPATAALGALVDMIYERFRPHLEGLPQAALPLEPIPFVTMPVYRR